MDDAFSMVGICLLLIYCVAGVIILVLFRTSVLAFAIVMGTFFWGPGSIYFTWKLYRYSAVDQWKRLGAHGLVNVVAFLLIILLSSIASLAESACR
jgi:hypothetical protein